MNTSRMRRNSSFTTMLVLLKLSSCVYILFNKSRFQQIHVSFSFRGTDRVKFPAFDHAVLFMKLYTQIWFDDVCQILCQYDFAFPFLFFLAYISVFSPFSSSVSPFHLSSMLTFPILSTSLVPAISLHYSQNVLMLLPHYRQQLTVHG